METIVIIIHVVIALVMLGLIMMQQGKGADAGASFGAGASQTVFGSQGGASFFAKVTAILAVVFFATSFSLTIIAKNKASVSNVDAGVPVAEQVVPVESDIPSVDDSSAALSEEIPVVGDSASVSDVPEVSAEVVPEDSIPQVEEQQ